MKVEKMTHWLEAIKEEITVLTKELRFLQSKTAQIWTKEVLIGNSKPNPTKDDWGPFSIHIALSDADRNRLDSHGQPTSRFIKVAATLSETPVPGFHSEKNMLVTINGVTWSAKDDGSSARKFSNWLQFRNNDMFFLEFISGDLFLYDMRGTSGSLIIFEKPPEIRTQEHDTYGLLHVSEADIATFKGGRTLSDNNTNTLTAHGHTPREFIEVPVHTRHVEVVRTNHVAVDFGSLELTVDEQKTTTISKNGSWAAGWQDFCKSWGNCYLEYANGAYTLRNIQTRHTYLTFSPALR